MSRWWVEVLVRWLANNSTFVSNNSNWNTAPSGGMFQAPQDIPYRKINVVGY